jgi:hypothetical protein
LKLDKKQIEVDKLHKVMQQISGLSAEEAKINYRRT